jgi:hypothetical protein
MGENPINNPPQSPPISVNTVTSPESNAQQNINNADFTYGDIYTALTAQNYNFGARTDFPVAEQTQTYFAYWDSVGGTGPEIIDQTAYFIKYIIDINGNVVNPEPDSLGSREEAVGLYNLLNNFEVGKKAIVKLIEPDPTTDAEPIGKCLLGSYDITGIGTIRNLLITETGRNYYNYIDTMSFYDSINESGEDVPLFRASYTLGATASIWTNTPVTASYIATGDYEEAGWEHSQISTGLIPNYTKPYYIFSPLTSSADAHTKVQVYFALGLTHNTRPGALGGYNNISYPDQPNYLKPNSIYFRLNKINSSGEHQIFGSGWIHDVPTDGTYKWYWVHSQGFTVNTSDNFVVTAYLAYNASGSNTQHMPIIMNAGSQISFIQERPPGTPVPGVNVAYSPFWDFVSHNPDGEYSTLRFSRDLRKIIKNTNYIQQVDPLSTTIMNFSPCSIPINQIAKGDLIRFEYAKNQIYRVINANIGSGSFDIDITPCLIPSSSVTCSIELNHFNIYRIENDGRYVILNVPKDTAGSAHSGVIQAQYSSTELLKNYDKIITDLTTREIIQ